MKPAVGRDYLTTGAGGTQCARGRLPALRVPDVPAKPYGAFGRRRGERPPAGRHRGPGGSISGAGGPLYTGPAPR
jgi:hypothetical protein